MNYPPRLQAALRPERLTISGSGGVRLNVWDHGGGGPPLLLCHCTGTLGRVWDPVVRKLAGAFRCIAVDTRGHGDSESPPVREAYAWRTSGEDLLHVVDALELGGPVMAAGHSGGGAHVAYAEYMRPGVFERVVLIDAIIGPRHVFQEPSPLAEKVRRRVNVFESLEAARERLTSKPPMSLWVEEAVAAYLEHGLFQQDDGSWALKCPGDREAWFYELGGASDLFEELDRLPVKTLLVAGGRDYGKALAELQHERLPHATLRVVEDAGHFVVQERPEAIARLLLEWGKPLLDAAG